jgi:hypothetical protein
MEYGESTRCERGMAAVRALLVMVLLLPCAALADVDLSTEPIRGQVLLPDSRPVPNGYVFARWFVVFNSIAVGGVACVKLAAVQADSNGTYEIPPWHKTYKGIAADSLSVELYTYRPGFVMADVKSMGAAVKGYYGRLSSRDVQLQMLPFVGGDKARADYLGTFVSQLHCDKDIRDGLPLYEAMIREIRTLDPNVLEKSDPNRVTLSDKLEMRIEQSTSKRSQGRDRK